MFIFRKEASAAMVSQHGPFTSYQVNVGPNGQNITADAANEPSIAVDPTNPNKMAIGWRQFDSVFSKFRQAGYGYTTNGGASWTFPGVLENLFRSDPVLAPNATGNFFYLSLLQTSPRLFEVQQSPRFMLLKMLQSFVELDMLGFSPEHEQPIHLA